VGSAVARELHQLGKKVKELTLRLEREAKARKLDAQLAAVAKKGREQLTREIRALREQGRKQNLLREGNPMRRNSQK